MPTSSVSETGVTAHDDFVEPKRIGIVATRIHGTDGVSLEINKWAEVLEHMGHKCFYIAGLSDRPPERTRIIPEAHFRHPAIVEIDRQAIGREKRSPGLTRLIHETLWVIKQQLGAIVNELKLDLIIAENCCTIPMNIPLGLAVAETFMETDVGCIAHHHDFFWERERYLVNAVDDYLRSGFPPPLRQMQHVVISTHAGREMSRRTGLSSRVIPNVMDFEHAPEPTDDYGLDFRQAIGLSDDDILILQPTRMVARKGIEHSIQLLRMLDDPRAKLVVTHASGDEGDEYGEHLRRFAAMLGIELIFADRWVTDKRGTAPDGRKLYAVADAYSQADLVTYPSTYEGFGNAFLEAIYYRKPLLCNRYTIFRTDLEPCNFNVILMDGFLTQETVQQVRRVLTDETYRQQMVDHNYDVAKQFFSYGRLEIELQRILAKPRFAQRHQ